MSIPGQNSADQGNQIHLYAKEINLKTEESYVSTTRYVPTTSLGLRMTDF